MNAEESLEDLICLAITALGAEKGEEISEILKLRSYLYNRTVYLYYQWP